MQNYAKLRSLFTAASGSPSLTSDSPTNIAPHPVLCTKATCSGVKIPLSPAIKNPRSFTYIQQYTANSMGQDWPEYQAKGANSYIWQSTRNTCSPGQHTCCPALLSMILLLFSISTMNVCRSRLLMPSMTWLLSMSSLSTLSSSAKPFEVHHQPYTPLLHIFNDMSLHVPRNLPMRSPGGTISTNPGLGWQCCTYQHDHGVTHTKEGAGASPATV